MKKIIYYFSGTGNSLQVARDLSQILGDATIKSIGSTANVDLSAEAIGIVFPVYLWGMPKIVSQFIEKMRGDTTDKYFFAIATYKSQAGDAIGQIQRKMKGCGIKLSSGFIVPMPGNNIIYYDVEPLQIRESKLSTCRNKLIEIAQTIGSKQETLPTVSITEKLLKTGLLHNLLTNTFKNSDKQFWVESTCNGCNVCSKVCPVNNIIMRDNHPVWQHHCQQCLACINLCPNKAIQHGKTTHNNQRYINPTVDIADLFR